MKYTVRVAGKNYEVEIEDLNTRPILARVDGETLEVMPENHASTRGQKNAEAMQMSVKAEADSGSGQNGYIIHAPLPGNVTEIFVRAGDEVRVGQVLLVIEAMKMKNSIRSTRSGKVATVQVSIGQTVAHKQALVEFA